MQLGYHAQWQLVHQHVHCSPRASFGPAWEWECGRGGGRRHCQARTLRAPPPPCTAHDTCNHLVQHQDALNLTRSQAVT